MSADIKANAIRMIEEVWNKRNLDVADELVHHDRNMPDSEERTGPEACKRLIRRHLKPFPDLRFTEHDVAGRGTCSATIWGDSVGVRLRACE